MEIQIKPWVIIALLGAGQGLILSLLLFLNSKGNDKSTKILSLLIMLFSLRLAEFTGYWTSFFIYHPHLSFITSSFPFLYGPLFFLFIKGRTNRNQSLKKFDLLHIIPFIIHLAIISPYYFQSSEYKISALMNSIYTNDPILPARFFVTRILQDIFMLIYLLMSLKVILNHKLGEGNHYGNKKSHNLNWLSNLSIGFLIFIALDILNVMELLIFKYRFVTEIESVLMLSSAVLIYTLGYFAMKRPQFISNNLVSSNGIKYEKSGLSEKAADLYLARVTNSMNKDKLFLKNNLSLKLLAEGLAIPQHHLSQILNEKLNKNFFDFINEYRVNEAKSLLMESEYSHYTILAIAHESGFNNKVSFNSAFKKFTGLTPSEFKNSTKTNSIAYNPINQT